MENIKQLLEQLNFKDDNGIYLPTYSEFWNKFKNRHKIGVSTELCFDDYVQFITQPLTKGMFLPCDEEGNVLEKPKRYEYWQAGSYIPNDNNYDWLKECLAYSEALDRVLFEDCSDWLNSKRKELITDRSFETIEQAINNNVKLYLK